MNVDIWHHAVNTVSKMDSVFKALLTSGAGLHGIEVDVRCCWRTSEPVLSHDPLPHHRPRQDQAGSEPKEALVEDPGHMKLASLCAALLSFVETTSADFAAVLKLDFKDELAATLVAEGKIPEVNALMRNAGRVQVWGNADLVSCESTAQDAFKAYFPSPLLWGRLAARYFPVLSIGFYRPATACEPYGQSDFEALETALHAVLSPTLGIEATQESDRAEEPVVVALTIPLRYRLFRDSLPAQAIVRDMLRAAASALRAHHHGELSKHRRSFLTVWRGRDDPPITDDDAASLKSMFPSCTIDRD